MSRVLSLLLTLGTKVDHIMGKLDDLNAAVAANIAADDAAITSVQTLAADVQKLTEELAAATAADDSAAIEAAVTALQGQTAKLNAVLNPPAAPAAPVA